ncbi:MAG: LamG-like jellyroll fold domain-containing protein [Candidatus Micrarchaeaceae archaeon]|jgi:uncharacterized protein (UPF0333 family)|nr:LamG domain-containing protein [Candidatus Micrarchaeota archaeon]HII09587.1 LamG domain-containing protein [Candidatus Micrarchaeota archaeon]
MLGLAGRGQKAQISLEFLIVYSFVLTIFVIMFALISTQRAASLVQQQYALLQSQAQAISTYINQAASAGSGYSATVPLLGGFVTHTYNISISNTGAIILSTKYGTQPITAYAFSNAKSFVINGTLMPQSTNGINIYQLQTFTGSISIYNSKGIIYIDQKPVSTANLAQGVLTTQQSDVKAALFNGQSSVISTTWLSNTPLQSLPSYTITGWIYMNAYSSTYAVIYGEGAPQATLFLTVKATSPGGCLDSGEWSLNYPGHWVLWCSGLNIPLHQWVFVAETLANGAVGSGTVTLYSSSPNFQYQTGPGQSESDIGINTIAIGMNPAQFAAAPYMYQFNGLIEDVQVYNSTLSPSQVQGIYQEGIGGAPLTASLVGYWPLNGNGNDYSGHGYVGVPNSVSYQSAIQLNSLLLPAANSVSKPIAGFVASAGNLGANGLSVVSTPDSNSIARAFLSSNGAFGSGNVVTDYFNGNLSTEGNLIGWWPLDTGYGNTIYDLSGQYNNGAFINGAWSSVNRTNFGAASFPGDPTGVSGSNTADGFITLSSSPSLLGVGANSTFTAVGWIYDKGATPSHCQGIFGDWPNTGAGFQLLGSAVSQGCALLYVNGNTVPWPSSASSFPQNGWDMVTAEYNGSTGQANVYLNNTLFSSNALPKGLPLVQTGNFLIGDDAWQPGGYDGFNGLISNLQFYYTYLTPSQISALYAQGPTSTPLGDAGLISWWPLSGNANDYSLNNEGIINYNVIFQNSNYTGNIATKAQAPGFATFSGSNSYISVPYSSILYPSQYISISLWFRTTEAINGGWTELIDTAANGNNCDLGSYCIRICCKAIYMTGGTTSGTDQVVYASNSSLPAGQKINGGNWNNVVGVYDGTHFYIYWDGVLRASTPVTGTFIQSANAINIGAMGGGGAGFQGSIADVQIYNSVLTQQQITQLYAQGFPPQSRLNVSLG